MDLYKTKKVVGIKTRLTGLSKKKEYGMKRISIKAFTNMDRFVPCLGRPHGQDDFLSDHRYASLNYASMKRRDKLPRLPSKLRSFKDKQSKKYFMKLWEGDFELDWREPKFRNPKNYERVELCVVADDNDQIINNNIPSSSVSNGKYSLVLWISIPIDFPFVSPFVPILRIEWNSLEPLYNESQLQALYTRIIHRFYRSHASHLSKFQLINIFKYLERQYNQIGLWKEMMDAITIICDVMLFSSLRSSSTVTDHFLYILRLAGENLAKHRYESAALMYEDVGVHWSYVGNDLRGKISQRKVWMNAGFAHRRNRHFSDSERCYVQALRADCSQHDEGWDLEKENVDALFGLRKLYLTVHVVTSLVKNNHISAGEAPDVSGLDKRLFPILNGLFSVVIAKPNLVYFAESSLQVKNKHIKSQTAAKQAIQKALGLHENTSKPLSVEDFRKKLLSYHNTKRKEFKIKLKNPHDWILELGIERDYQTFYKRWVFSEKCDNCHGNFAPGTICYCPCTTVGYCSKKCQLEHWKTIHKADCSTRTKKNITIF
ncbi:MYND finger domain containing protein [Nitzschia inconspicua]|uniref:MYND finger domain containing protein n=1 Tax=Nitzschia inconspicua TaxID=303405 RepID=A0A9K3LXR9_9STRA|nr:MYND finger domain containing protein [Nitzschia inconspicua]